MGHSASPGGPSDPRTVSGLCGTQAENSSQEPKAHAAFDTLVVVNSQTLRVDLVSGHRLLSLRRGLISNMSEPLGICI